jgi:hypothetical protein
MSKRTTVSLDDRDEELIATVSNPARIEWRSFHDLAFEVGVDIKPHSSEATAIRALVRIGAQAVREQMLDRGYAEAAEIWDEVFDPEESGANNRRNDARRPAEDL